MASRWDELLADLAESDSLGRRASRLTILYRLLTWCIAPLMLIGIGIILLTQYAGAVPGRTIGDLLGLLYSRMIAYLGLF